MITEICRPPYTPIRAVEKWYKCYAHFIGTFNVVKLIIMARLRISNEVNFDHVVRAEEVFLMMYHVVMDIS